MHNRLFIVPLLSLFLAGCTGTVPMDEGLASSESPIRAIALAAETASALEVRIAQWGFLEEPVTVIERPATLSMRRDGRLLAFRVPGDPSQHLAGAFDFYAHGPHLGITVITQQELEVHFDTIESFLEAFGTAALGTPNAVAVPADVAGWNGLILISELDSAGIPTHTTAERATFRKVPR